MTVAFAALALLLAPRFAAAQYPVGDRASRLSVGRSYYESQGPGYSGYYSSAELATRYAFYPGKYTGVSYPERFATTNGYYATRPSGYSPILFTSLNYPEVYGSYTLGLGGSGSVSPVIQTLPDNPPSANPVGAPYAPLTNPLALSEVPKKREVELTTTVPTTAELSTRPTGQAALIDVVVPADATLSFQGVTMSEPGTLRQFQSPLLQPNRSYTYDIQASWKTSDGQQVVRSRQLTVHAGDHLNVDLSRDTLPPPSEPDYERPMLRTQPLKPRATTRPAPEK
jgi:uncharacterized protein (TIGR03000 family)